MKKLSVFAAMFLASACTDPISGQVAQDITLAQMQSTSDQVPFYRATGVKSGMNNLQYSAVLARYATLPGAPIAGPNGTFSVRKVSSDNGSPIIVAIDTGLTDGNSVVRLIAANTDCEIPRGVRITPLNVGISRLGFSVICL